MTDSHITQAADQLTALAVELGLSPSQAYMLTDDYQDQHDRFMSEQWEASLASMPPAEAARARQEMATEVADWARLWSLPPVSYKVTVVTQATGVRTGVAPRPRSRERRASRRAGRRKASRGDDRDSSPERRGETFEEAWDRTRIPPRNWDRHDLNAIKHARILAHRDDPVNGVARFDASLRLPTLTIQRDGGAA